MPVVRLYIYFLGAFYFMIRRNERKKIAACQNHILQQISGTAKMYHTVIRTFLGTFDHYYEKLVMAHRPLSEMKNYLAKRLELSNRKYLDTVIRDGKGALLVTGHFGAVEFLPLAMSLEGYRIAMIVRYKTQRLKHELTARAAELDITLIDAAEPRAAFKALKALKQGRILITECDEFKEWRQSRDQKVNVFGRSMPVDKTLDFFYRRTGVPAFLGLMKRDKKGYTLCIEPLADGKSKVSLARRAWNRMEQFILQYPAQWYQWKNLAPVLAPIRAADQIDGYRKNQYIPVKDSFLPANFA